LPKQSTFEFYEQSLIPMLFDLLSAQTSEKVVLNQKQSSYCIFYCTNMFQIYSTLSDPVFYGNDPENLLQMLVHSHLCRTGLEILHSDEFRSENHVRETYWLKLLIVHESIIDYMQKLLDFSYGRDAISNVLIEGTCDG